MPSTKFSENYELKEELGHGAFSIVKRCVQVGSFIFKIALKKKEQDLL
jgi:hypothetical protein